ncbi:MAG: hypothetical protein U5K31_00945 [Balneolaceae bacterium]|nr:hypothetical protein [Balneolaceae bacterium]
MRFPTLLTCIFLLTAPAVAQQTAEEEEAGYDSATFSLFLDCQGWCSENYIREGITFVNFVRNKDVADMHLLITQEGTGNGGQEYTMKFLGSNQFEGKNDTLTFYSPATDSQDEWRRRMVRYVKIGLLPYLRDYGVLDEMEVTYTGEGTETDAQSGSRQEDPWNNWVFELNGDTRLNGEEAQSRWSFSGSAEASRVTENWKTRISYDQDYTRRSFTRDGETETFVTENYRGDFFIIKSLGPHWSAGVSGDAYSSTRQNVDFSASGGAAVEYSLYPYSEYSEREITLQYRLSGGYYDYTEMTLFNETSEYLTQQRLEARMNFTQAWGQIEGRLNASTYLHDLNKNRLDVNLEFDFRVFRGLSFNVSGRYAWINDQLGVPAGDISEDEQLLDLRQQLTSYSYGLSFGIEWTFGSIYNNVVNPRF